MALLASCTTWLGAAEESRFSNAAVEARLLDGVRYLAGEELAGRGVGSPGIEKAADYIAEQFAVAGLKTDAKNGGPFQAFTMTIGTELGKVNDLALVGPEVDGKAKRIELKLGETFNPLSIGGSGPIDAQLVFAGYGISAKDLSYDDYAGLNLEGKAVIVLRHEPEQSNPHSSFNGTSHSQYAPFGRKLSNAFEHGAAAVVFVTDDYEIQQRVEQRLKVWRKPIDELAAAQGKFVEIKHPTLDQIEAYQAEVAKLVNDEWFKELKSQSEKLSAEFDPLMGFRAAGGGDTGRIPVVHCRRSAIDKMLKASLNTDLATLEKQIDQGPKPQSRELTGWRLQGEISVTRTQAKVKNVIAVLPGSGPKADETIVIGAHYDHLGMGGEGSLAPQGTNEIHNGADDNASGATALLEVARHLASRAKPLPRRVVFVAFTGEERGLLGSAKYCNEPLVPLAQTVAMLNMDMVGRLTDDKLIVQGCDTAKEFDGIVDRVNEVADFKITRQSGGFGPSDHASFYGKKIPVMHFFTGTHKDYHRPTDDIDKLNIPGMRRVADLVAEVAVAIAEADTRPTYVEVKASRPNMGGGDRPYFGSIPDFAQEEPGYKLSGVTKDGPAEKGGLRSGDIIIKLGESKIGNLEDFDSALRKFKGGDKASVIVKRDGKEVAVQVTLDPPR